MPQDDNETADSMRPRPVEATAGSERNSLSRSKTIPLSRSNTSPLPILQDVDEKDEPGKPPTHLASNTANDQLDRKLYKVTVGLLIVAILTLIVVTPPGFFSGAEHTFSGLIEGQQNYQVRLPRADPAKFTVLVAELDHDEGNTARDAIVVALEDTAGITVDRLDLAIPAGKTSEVEAGHECARKYLKDSGAKLLIWGTRLTVDGHETINLYLTPLQAAYLPDTAKLY